MRGIRIGILYELKGKLNAGLDKIKDRMGQVNQLQKKARLRTREYFDSFSKGVKDATPSLDKFSLKNSKLFDAISDRVPFLSNLGGLLANPYVLATAAVVALITAVFNLGSMVVETSKQIQQNQRLVQATFGIVGQELDTTTSKVMAISKILDIEMKDLAKAANSLHKEYKDTGVTVQDSLHLIKSGIQATNGQFDLEEVKEYASQMKAAGLSAQEFIALSVIGKREGIFNDKAVDAVKEFNLRIKEMTPAAKTALKGIGLNADTLLDALNKGSMGTVDILRLVSDAMGKANSQARQTAIADLFGGAGEDAGERFLLSLGKMKFSIDGITNGMQNIIGHQNKQIALTEQINQKQAQYAKIINPLREEFELFTLKAKVLFFDVVAKGIIWLKANFQDLRKVIVLVGVALGVAFFPLVKIPLIVAGIIFLLKKLYDNSRLFRAVWAGIIEHLKNVWKMLVGIGGIIEGIFTLDFNKIKEGFKTAGLALINTLSGFSFVDGFAKKFRSEVNKTKDSISNKSIKNTSTLNNPIPTLGNENNHVTGVTTAGSVASKNVQQRNVTVNIQNLNEGGIHVKSETVEDSGFDIESRFIEMLIRAVRNSEVAL